MTIRADCKHMEVREQCRKLAEAIDGREKKVRNILKNRHDNLVDNISITLASSHLSDLESIRIRLLDIWKCSKWINN